MIQRSRLPAMAAPRLERTFGSGIQQSSMLMPAASQRSTTALTSAALWRSSHSPPRPISLTDKPVFPNALYFMGSPPVFSATVRARTRDAFAPSPARGPAMRALCLSVLSMKLF